MIRQESLNISIIIIFKSYIIS